MGFLPLFAMITSGGPYTEFVEAAEAVTSHPGAGYAFFISFYVVGVLIFFNVFSAFVIDAWASARGNRSEASATSGRLAGYTLLYLGLAATLVLTVLITRFASGALDQHLDPSNAADEKVSP